MGSPPKWASPERGGPSGGHAPRRRVVGRATSGLPRGAHLGPAAAPLAGEAMWGLVPRGLAKEGGLLPPPIYRGGTPLPFGTRISLFNVWFRNIGAAYFRGVSPLKSTALILVLRSSSSSSAAAVGPELGDRRYTVRV